MRDEKEERKKQARSNKQTSQSNTAHPSIHNIICITCIRNVKCVICNCNVTCVMIIHVVCVLCPTGYPES